MAQQMITLEEAAERLGLTPEEMKKRLKTDPEFKRLSTIRDGATVRFKLSAIDELARELGMSSETDLPLAPLAEDPGSDDFKVPVVDDKKKTKKSDADVPLDFDSGSSEDDVFSLADDSKAVSPKSSAKLTPNKPSKGMSDSSSGSSTDSDVKLDGGKKKPKSDEAAVPTEEIALDFSGPGSAVIKGGSSAKLSAPKTGSSPGKLSSPGEPAPAKKSDSAKKSDAKKPDAKKSDAKKSNASRRSDALRGIPGAPPADSSEFELSLDADSDDFELQMSGDSSGDEVDLGTLPKDKAGIARGSKSGINLRDPADSGISLEKGKDKAKDAKGSDSKKGTKGPKDSADDSSDSGTTTAPSNMDFELSLDSSEAASTSKLGAPKSGKLVLDSESDSEFELTLDDSSSSSLEQAALGAEGLEGGEDKGDIFETDFEIPPMPDESASEAVAVDSDSDVAKADFEMAPDDSDVAADEPSQSAVVLVDDEDGPKARKKPKKPASKASIADVDLGDAGLEEVEDDEDSAAGALKGAKGRRKDEDEEEEEEAVPAGAVVERPTKPWGVVPALFLAPTLLITLLGALMGYELLQTMWGYQQPRKPTAPIIRGLATNLDMPLNDQ